MGVGLGLAGYQPDELDLKQVQQAVRVSEELEIEQTMFEDKLKTTDWEATNEAIEEQIARESYLNWCRENMQRTKRSVSSTVTSASSQAHTSALFMPGSSGSAKATAVSAAVSCSVGGGGGGATTGTLSSITAVNGECNSNTSTTMISSGSSVTADNNGTSSSASPKQQNQSDDGQKSGGSSSTYTSTASSSSSGSSGSIGLLTFEGGRQRRRRRRHNHSHQQQQQQQQNHSHPVAGARASPPGLGNLHLAETRSTDSNDSDCSEETMSKKMKRRLEQTEEQKQEVVGGLVVKKAVEQEKESQDNEQIGSSVELHEPGPSKSGPEGGGAGKPLSDPVTANFYHSLLESSYMDDGEDAKDNL